MTASLQDENLLEYVDSAGTTLRIDKNAGILRGVKLIGLISQNGRRYRETALTNAEGLYEEAKVNVNHPKEGPLAPRDYQDRLGVIRGVKMRQGEGLFGDLHFNPKHALAEQLVWDAQHNPSNVGFSHNIQAKVSREGETTVVESIARVQSVDLVADPASTRGLFEQKEEQSAKTPTEAPLWDALTVETLRLHRPDILEQMQSEEARQLRLQLEEADGREKKLRHHQRVLQLLSDHGLPAPGGKTNRIVSQVFFEMLLKTQDEAEIETLVAERAELRRFAPGWQSRGSLENPHAMSRDQAAVLMPNHGERFSSADFARALKSV